MPASSDGGSELASSPLGRFFLGGLAGSLAKTIIAPLDRAKILFQISNERFSLRAVARSLATTLRTEGARALFRAAALHGVRWRSEGAGASPRVARV